MIRRLFWMTVGAVAGVTGYRRASRLARALQPKAPGRNRRGGRDGDGGLATFLGDVRDGMELYLDRRSPPPGPTLEGQHVLADSPGQTTGRRAHAGTDYAKDGR